MLKNGQEHHIEFGVSGEQSWEAVDTAEWARDPAPPPVHDGALMPRAEALPSGRDHRHEAEVQWAGFVTFANPAEDQGDWPDCPPQVDQRPSSLSGILGMLKSFKAERSR